MKTLIIGFDALDFKAVRETGILQGFKKRKMIAPEPLTGPGWTTLYTGETMQQHGIKSVHGIFDTPQSKSFKTCKSKFMWEYLNEKGLRTEFMNLPVTHPARKVDGFMVSGGVLTEGDYTYPKDLVLKDYIPHIWSYLEKAKGFDDNTSRGRASYIKDYQGKKRGDIDCGLGDAYGEINTSIIKNFLALHNPGSDLAFIGFTFIDRVGHWSAMNPKQQKYWYLNVQAIVDTLCDNVQADNVIICSDHGHPTSSRSEKKHESRGVFAYNGDVKLAELNQYDFLPSVLSLYGINVAGLQGRIVI